MNPLKKIKDKINKIKLSIQKPKAEEGALEETEEESSSEKEQIEDVKPLNKIIWRAKVMWPIHKIEPEEARVIRAIAWAKRRFDYIARAMSEDIIVKYITAKEELRSYERDIKNLKKEIRKIEKEIKRERKRLRISGKDSYAELESLEREKERRERELDQATRFYYSRAQEIEQQLRESKQEDLVILKERFRGEVPRVLEETVKMFNISSPSLIERIRFSLLDFADAEAAKIIEMIDYNIISRVARNALWFIVKEIYRPIGGPFASTYETIGIVWRFIFEFIFSPIVIGTILLWLLFSIFLRYVITGPISAVVIITTIITVLITLGQYWSEIFKIFE